MLDEHLYVYKTIEHRVEITCIPADHSQIILTANS